MLHYVKCVWKLLEESNLKYLLKIISDLSFLSKRKAKTSEIKIDPNEIEDAIWVSREDMARAFAGEHDKIRPPRRGAIAGFILEHWLKDRLD